MMKLISHFKNVIKNLNWEYFLLDVYIPKMMKFVIQHSRYLLLFGSCTLPTMHIQNGNWDLAGPK